MRPNRSVAFNEPLGLEAIEQLLHGRVLRTLRIRIEPICDFAHRDRTVFPQYFQYRQFGVCHILSRSCHLKT